MVFDYSKLLGKIKECGYTQGTIANLIGISENAFTNKIKCRYFFTALEIAIICNILGIIENDIGLYFFTLKV